MTTSLMRQARSNQLRHYIGEQSSKSILNIVLDVHMVRTGAMDYYKHYLKDVSLLRHAIKNWMYDRNDMYKEFDEKVRQLILQALEDHKWFMSTAKEWLDDSVLEDEEYFLKSSSDKYKQ